MGVWVYKQNGSRFCQEADAEVSLYNTNKELIKIIGEKNIISRQVRQAPIITTQRCGDLTAMVNAFEITKDGAVILFSGTVGSMGFSLWCWPSDEATFDDRWVPWPWSSEVATDAASESGVVRPARANLMDPGDGPIVPWPTQETAGDKVFVNLLASLTQVGVIPTQIRELIGRKARCYRQGEPLPFDFVPDRVNVEMNEKSEISRIWFG